MAARGMLCVIVNRRLERAGCKDKYFTGSYIGTQPIFTSNFNEAFQYIIADARAEIVGNLGGTAGVAGDYDIIPLKNRILTT